MPLTSQQSIDNGILYRDFHVGLTVRARQAFGLLRGQTISRVLDVGCADAAFLTLFPPWVEKYGVDIAPSAHRPPDMRLVQVDVSRDPLPFAMGVFDVVYAGEIIEHVLDTLAFLREVRRVLRPGGSVVLTTPNLCSLKNLYCWLTGRQLAWVDYKLGQHGHVRYFSPCSLRQVLTESGFQVGEICTSGFEVGAHVRGLEFLTPVTRWIFAHSIRGNCLISRAVKTTADPRNDRADKNDRDQRG